MNIVARYENGVFRPLEAVAIKEGTVVEIQVPMESGPPVNRVIVSLDSDIFGLWRDRTDIDDSVDYVNQLRSNPRN